MIGKSVIVTGAASGIGRAAAIRIAQAGGQLVVADRDEEQGRATVKAISEAGGEAHFVRVDVADESSVQNMVDETLRKYGKLDAAFNNAGVAPSWKRLHELASADWERCIRTNLTSVFWCMKYEITAMLSGGGGSILNTASIGAVGGISGVSEYAASKAGILGMTRVAAVEYARQNIRVNAVLPGSIATPMTLKAFGKDPAQKRESEEAEILGRFGRPDEIGEVALWLLSDAASLVTGVSMPVDGGRTAAA